MRCEERDQNLLLLAHGAMPLWRQWLLHAHLHQCMVCKERYAHWVQVSDHFAHAIRQPGSAPWMPAPAPASSSGKLPLLLAILGFVFVLFGLVSAPGIYHALRGHSRRCLSSQQVASPTPGAASTIIKSMQPKSSTTGCTSKHPAEPCK